MTPKQARAEWVKALRSGEFEQNRGSLNCDGALDSLGVACEVHRRLVTKSAPWDESGVYLDHDDHLPPEVVEWLGLASNSGELVERLPVPGLPDLRMSTDLEECNDTARMTLPQIAGLIESGKVKTVDA